MPKVFIDGQAGTTGLQIHRALAERSDIELLQIDERHRKDPGARRELLNRADLVLLCLPDDAAREAVHLVESEHVKIIDASTAHRIDAGWTYGLPELCPEQRGAIAAANRVANTGCYAAGFLLLVAPLVRATMLPPDSQLSVNALSGYSGGGRSLIEKYEANARDGTIATRPYALGLDHKHLPEMQLHSGLEKVPLFTPAVGDFYQGMLVEVPLFRSQIAGGHDANDLLDCLAEHYRQEPCVRVHALNETAVLVDGYLDPEANNGTNRVDLLLYANEERMVLIARLDNLGKGASGAAVQNLNLMLGCDELAGIAL